MILLGMDVVQLLANTVFGHAFGIEKINLYGEEYYRMIPYLPQNLHRILVYLILTGAMLILAIRMFQSSRIHSRRYAVIFYSALAVILWCSYYVVSGTPLDRSMTGYAAFGLLAFYFSLYYKPVRLLDRLLLDISAELPDALFFFDDTGACIWANNEGLRLAGVTGTGNKLDQAAEKIRPYIEAVGEQKEKDNWSASLSMDSGEGRRYYVLEGRTIRDDKGRIDGSLLNIHDDTQARMELKKEIYTARHDELTGVYTRQYLYQRIREIIEADKSDTKYCIVFTDVSNFKLVNDVFGHAFGDKVLKQFADLIREHISDKGIYGRLSGDTFGILIPEGEYSAAYADEILSGFVVNDGEITYHVHIHLGVFEINEPEMEVSVMFDRARMAVTGIKNDLHTHIAWYDDKMRSKMVWEQEISSSLETAIKERQIIPYLQPLVNSERQIIGAEALVRWIHPEHGFLSPADFIPVFEKNGMIVNVDRYMWRCACELLSKWKDNDMFLSINVSPKDFYFTDVAADLRELVKEYGIAPLKLRIEITESFMISDVESKIRMITSLQEDGFIVEMDDFGSGYSSLNLLKEMPVDVIKIDMGFIRNADGDEKSMKILHNIINMSTDLEIAPLAEGVETEKQFELLSQMGCELFQGYYFAKPMPVEQFEKDYI